MDISKEKKNIPSPFLKGLIELLFDPNNIYADVILREPMGPVTYTYHIYNLKATVPTGSLKIVIL